MFMRCFQKCIKLIHSGFTHLPACIVFDSAHCTSMVAAWYWGLQ
jgi:hypothetical protein